MSSDDDVEDRELRRDMLLLDLRARRTLTRSAGGAVSFAGPRGEQGFLSPGLSVSPPSRPVS
ncbi:MAG TPA: hypothetical protein VK053_06360 [Jiangellaceae bacterium]|nr:hypothetical protein [Jiangellaceae bacterium]